MDKAVIPEAGLLVGGYRRTPGRNESELWDDVGQLRHLAGYVRGMVNAAHPELQWHDRFTWFLIGDVLSTVDDQRVDDESFLVVAKHLLACGGPYPDTRPVPGRTKGGQPLTLGDVRLKAGTHAASSYEESIELRRLFCARILGQDTNIFKEQRSNARSAGKAMLDEIKTAITAPGYIADRIDGYTQRLNDESQPIAGADSAGEQRPERNYIPGSSRFPNEADQHPIVSSWRTAHPLLKAASMVGAIGLVAAGVWGMSSQSRTETRVATSTSGATTTAATSLKPLPPAIFRANPNHECLNPNPSTEANNRPEICVIAWCSGAPLNIDGSENTDNVFIKIRPGILNTSGDPIDLSITRVSAMRLLIAEPRMPGSWNPPADTAAAGDRPILVEWAGNKYWAVAPNLPSEYIPLVPTDEPGIVRFQRFKTFWDAGVIAGGESYYRSIIQLSNDPMDVVQEADLVFEFPRNSGVYGLAIVQRSDPTSVLAVAEAGPDAVFWGPSRIPSTF